MEVSSLYRSTEVSGSSLRARRFDSAIDKQRGDITPISRGPRDIGVIGCV
jgi:hypothetical protein